MMRTYAVIPSRALSRIAGRLSRLRPPRRMLDCCIRRYAAYYGVDTGEMEVPPGGFSSFNQFFTRRLAEGARSVDGDGRAVVSPVDGRIDQFGGIRSGTMPQAKGITYSLFRLIPSDAARAFADGDFITIYLAPGDYHRIHSPVDGTITGYLHIPGRLLSVRPSMARTVPDLYTGNERVVTFISSARGTVAVCKVGAANVGAVTLSYDEAASGHFSRRPAERAYGPAERRDVRRGDEIGVFNLGSTVIALFERGMLRFTVDAAGRRVRMGEQIAVLTDRNTTGKTGRGK
ncbi:MAG: phosphatidylserine decarboxylase [Spirochaetes bacterium]|nr:phosphatidylserine decarboxylase [Spirochaetota bacterium]